MLSNAINSALSKITSSSAVQSLLGRIDVASSTLASHGITPSSVLKVLGLSLVVDLAIAVAGKGLQELGKSAKKPLLTQCGDVVVKIGEFGLKVVLVPPVACFIGIKWFLTEGLPNMVRSGRTKRILKSVFHYCVYVPVSAVTNFVADHFLTPTVNALHAVYDFAIDIVMMISLASVAYFLRAQVVIHVAAFAALAFIVKTTTKIIGAISDCISKSVIYTLQQIADVTLFAWKRILLPTFRFTKKNILIPFRDRVLIPTRNGLEILGEKILYVANRSVDFASTCATRIADGGSWLLENILKPTGRKIMWLINKTVDGIKATVNFIVDKMLVPTGKGVLWVFDKIVSGVEIAIHFVIHRVIIPTARGIVRGVIWFYENVMTPTGKFIVKALNKVADAIIMFIEFVGKTIIALLRVIRDGAIWFYDRILRPIGEGILWVFEKIVSGIEAAIKFVVDKVIMPVGRGIVRGAIWFYERILTPIGQLFKTIIVKFFDLVEFVIVKIGRAISISAQFVWNNMFKPVIFGVVGVVVRVSNAVSSCAIWFWQSVLLPAAIGIKNAVLAITNAIVSFAQSVYNSVVRPLSIAVTNLVITISVTVKNVAVTVGGTIASVAVSVSNVVVSSINALVVLINQVVASVSNIVAGIAQTIARIFGG